MNSKNFLKKIWNFYWKEESILSYVFFVVITYLALKFLLLPGFLLITNLSDIVAIMSSSMEHSGMEDLYYDTYFMNLNYSINDINNFAYSNGLNIGDVILVRQTNNYTVGDIIVFYGEGFNDKIIHRIVSTDPLTTKGDNNIDSYSFDQNITHVVGEVVLRIPFLGYPRWLMYLALGF